MTVAIEITGYNLNTNSVQTLYFSDDGFMSSPTDTPANTYYEPRISAPPHFLRTLFSTAQASFGSSSASSTPGDILFENSDGGVDYLTYQYAFNGQPFVMRVGTIGTPLSTWTVAASGTLSDIQASSNTQVSILVNDQQTNLSLPQVRPQYGGTNVLPNGIDGTPNDLMGQYIPRVYGTVQNVPPKCVNTSLLIYQVSDQSNCSITQVYDNGVALTAATPYASLAALQASAPAAGNYGVFQGYFRLGSSPASQVTCDATTPGLTTVANILQQLALDSGFIKQAAISSADVTALNALNSATVGVWADGSVSTQNLMDLIAVSIGAYYSFDRFGVLRMNQVAAPGGTAAYTIDDTVLEDIQIREAGIPSYQVTINYSTNYTVQNQPAGSVSVARRAFLSQANRTQVAKNTAVQTAWPSAGTQTFTTALINQSDATAIAAQMLAVFSRRLLMTASIPLSELGTLDIGSVVGFTYNRYNLPSKKMLIVGVDAGADTNVAALTLWG
jgi:hypothetical protein